MQEVRRFMDRDDGHGRKVGNWQWGIYAFYDYDGEPIYVGQTAERLRGRVSRHLSNQRTDAVAMNVLDPFEVAEVEVWPLDLAALTEVEREAYLDRAESTVFQKLLASSRFGAVLNEAVPPTRVVVELPPSFRGRIIPEELFKNRRHSDLQIARRASTIAALARVISERKVSVGLRRTLLTQARRLELLARERLEDFTGREEEEPED